MKAKTHWLQSPNKNYLGHWDLPEEDLILTIKSAKWEEVENPVLKKTDPKKFEAKKVIRFEEDYKPLICNQTNASSIIKSTGMKYMEDSTGKKIALYIAQIVDRKTKEDIDCIRIRSQVVKQLPVLEYNTKEYEKVLSAIMSGYTIEQIRTKWTITKDLENKINEEI